MNILKNNWSRGEKKPIFHERVRTDRFIRRRHVSTRPDSSPITSEDGGHSSTTKTELTRLRLVPKVRQNGLMCVHMPPLIVCRNAQKTFAGEMYLRLASTSSHARTTVAAAWVSERTDDKYRKPVGAVGLGRTLRKTPFVCATTVYTRRYVIIIYCYTVLATEGEERRRKSLHNCDVIAIIIITIIRSTRLCSVKNRFYAVVGIVHYNRDEFSHKYKNNTRILVSSRISSSLLVFSLFARTLKCSLHLLRVVVFFIFFDVYTYDLTSGQQPFCRFSCRIPFYTHQHILISMSFSLRTSTPPAVFPTFVPIPGKLTPSFNTMRGQGFRISRSSSEKCGRFVRSRHENIFAHNILENNHFHAVFRNEYFFTIFESLGEVGHNFSRTRYHRQTTKNNWF